MKYDQAKAKELAEKIVEAKAGLSRYLHECFPIGEPCSAILMVGQKNPSFGTVFGVRPTIFGGEITVKLNESKARGSRRFRSVPARDVVMSAADTGCDDGGSRTGHCDY